jgi:hypothetical protein
MVSTILMIYRLGPETLDGIVTVFCLPHTPIRFAILICHLCTVYMCVLSFLCIVLHSFFFYYNTMHYRLPAVIDMP